MTLTSTTVETLCRKTLAKGLWPLPALYLGLGSRLLKNVTTLTQHTSTADHSSGALAGAFTRIQACRKVLLAHRLLADVSKKAGVCINWRKGNASVYVGVN